MGFFGGVIAILPFLAGFVGLIIFLFFFIGTCLLAGGISGFIINWLYKKGTGSQNPPIIPLFNIFTAMTGLIILLIPIGFTMYEFIKLIL